MNHQNGATAPFLLKGPNRSQPLSRHHALLDQRLNGRHNQENAKQVEKQH
jgi:hypothetical protein